MPQLVECTEAELVEFMKAYPRTTERDVFGIHEPPLVTFNDFTLGNWPESVVASYVAGDLPGEPAYYGPAKGFRVLRPESEEGNND